MLMATFLLPATTYGVEDMHAEMIEPMHLPMQNCDLVHDLSNGARVPTVARTSHLQQERRVLPVLLVAVPLQLVLLLEG